MASRLLIHLGLGFPLLGRTQTASKGGHHARKDEGDFWSVRRFTFDLDLDQ